MTLTSNTSLSADVEAAAVPVSSANDSAIDAAAAGDFHLGSQEEAPPPAPPLQVQIEMNSEEQRRLHHHEEQQPADLDDIESPSSASDTTNVEVTAAQFQFYDDEAAATDGGENDVTFSTTSTAAASSSSAVARASVSFHPKHLDDDDDDDEAAPSNPRTLIRRQSSKFATYALKVDPNQGDRAAEIKLCNFSRPHMRAFHFAWWCYHVAFLMWFAISPLLGEVQKSLDLTTEQIWTSSITAVSSTIIMRFILGPFCDKYGPRLPMGVVLMMSAIPTGMIGLVNTATGLAVIRFFIGVGGSTFVMAQYWTTRMFTKEWAGTANATVGGWGNLGGGVTQILVGSILFPLLKNAYGGGDEGATKAWRTACVVPSAIGIITAICVVKFTDDSPTGNYSKMKKTNVMADVSMAKSFRHGALDVNTWLMFVQYACCFGVEITMNNAAALYFREAFGLSTESAAAVASIFGWMNLFARGTGGFISDKANARRGMNGRLWWQTICLLLEGFLVIVFAYCSSLGGAIAVLVFFSIFVQAAEGSSYGIVPYINPPYTGSIAGIIGAGGNTGSFAFSFCFRQMDSKTAFVTMGIIILFSSVLSVFIRIKGHPTLLCPDPALLAKTTNKNRANVDDFHDEEQNSEAKEEKDTDACSMDRSRTTSIDVESGDMQAGRSHAHVQGSQ